MCRLVTSAMKKAAYLSAIERERESRLERTNDEMKQREEGEERVARIKREKERERDSRKSNPTRAVKYR